MNNKIKNAKKLFRQGRITYKKLKTIVGLNFKPNEENLTEELANEHVHGENCNHDHSE